MAIPTASNYPVSFDNDTNLYVVHDALRMRLAKDYNPGDTSITVEGSSQIMALFPPTGKITLTEQCSDVDKRAISFFYGSLQNDPNGEFTFDDLEIFPGFEDVIKPKRITNVTMNVMAPDHNNLKDTLIAIETFAGVEGTQDSVPFGPTMEGRTNFLRQLVLTPKAWFSVPENQRIGIVPLTVTFQDLSFRLEGSDTVILFWDFGDGSTETQTVSGGTVTHTYTVPGIFDVSLTVTNDFGEDEVIFPNLINPRIEAPDTAEITFIPNTAFQTLINPTLIRAPINSLIKIQVVNNMENPSDPIATYTWEISDDLIHANAPDTSASFSIGNIYDLSLRVDTEAGAYRITTLEDSMDVIENINLWLWTFQNTTDVLSFEFGLISETFKTNSSPPFFVQRDSSFLLLENNSDKQITEFNKNTGFAPIGSVNSGNKNARTLLYWATGRTQSQVPSAERIKFVEYDAFADVYIEKLDLPRPWNWFTFNSAENAFFAFGTNISGDVPFQSPTNLDRLEINLLGPTVKTVSPPTFDTGSFQSGAEELTQNPAVFDPSTGESLDGNFSVYRSTFKDNVGYVLRNEGTGALLRIRSFYQTTGSVSDPVQGFNKLQDMQGPTKLEGELVSLTQGVFFFSNSGSFTAFTTADGVWKTGGPGVNSVVFRSLQDTTVTGFDNPANTLLAASDQDRRAYLSFDYSSNAFIKFSETDSTFSSLVPRPTGEQWLMGIF